MSAINDMEAENESFVPAKYPPKPRLQRLWDYLLDKFLEGFETPNQTLERHEYEHWITCIEATCPCKVNPPYNIFELND